MKRKFIMLTPKQMKLLRLKKRVNIPKFLKQIVSRFEYNKEKDFYYNGNKYFAIKIKVGMLNNVNPPPKFTSIENINLSDNDDADKWHVFVERIDHAGDTDMRSYLLARIKTLHKKFINEFLYGEKI